jgi:DNA-binding LacI/PurR family transcriptional regulator
MAKIGDVARLAGVSISTVSNVLNGRAERMRGDTLSRVESAIAELGFRPNQAARLLKTGHTPLLGVLVPSLTNPMYGAIASAVEAEAQARHGYRVLLGNTYRSREKERSFFDDLLSHGVRGVIIISSLVQEGHFRSAIERGLVVVSYDRRATPDTQAHLDHVSVDNFAAGRIAAEHLITRGHEALAFVTASGKTMSRSDKIDGFLAAAREAGLQDRVEVIEGKLASEYGDAEMAELGRVLAQKIARRRPRPSAIAAVNDMLAIGLMAGFRTCGVAVPDEISVIGFDDMFLSSLVTPALTTVRVPVAQLARVMVDRLVARLGDPSIATSEFLFAPELIVRQSVGACRTKPSKRPPARSRRGRAALKK